MRITIEITDDELGEDTEYTAELVMVTSPFTGWDASDIKFTHRNGASEYDALDNLIDALEDKTDRVRGDIDKEKLASWNRNVMDWKHVREQHGQMEVAV